MLVMVVVVCMSTSPPVFLLILLFLTLGATLHGVHVTVCVGMCVGMCVGQQRRRGGQLFQSCMCGFHPDCGFAQQVNSMGQSRQDELKTLLKKTTQSTFKLLPKILHEK